jgi:hypothetical protein
VSALVHSSQMSAVVAWTSARPPTPRRTLGPMYSQQRAAVTRAAATLLRAWLRCCCFQVRRSPAALPRHGRQVRRRSQHCAAPLQAAAGSTAGAAAAVAASADAPEAVRSHRVAPQSRPPSRPSPPSAKAARVRAPTRRASLTTGSGWVAVAVAVAAAHLAAAAAAVAAVAEAAAGLPIAARSGGGERLALRHCLRTWELAMRPQRVSRSSSCAFVTGARALPTLATDAAGCARGWLRRGIRATRRWWTIGVVAGGLFAKHQRGLGANGSVRPIRPRRRTHGQHG